MTINPMGGGGSNLPLNIEDLMKSASPEGLKQLAETARKAGADGADAEVFAQISAFIEKQMQESAGGARQLPAPEGRQGAEVSGTLGQLGSISEQDVQTDIYAFMALFQQLAQTMRSAAREVRQAEMTAQVDTLKGAAQEIRNAAHDRMVGAIVSGTFQIAGGLAQVGSGMMQGRVLAKGGEGAESVARSYSDTGSGISGVAGGIGTIVNAAQERKAAEHDAKKAELEAQSKVHESGMQQASEMAQQMMDVIRDVREKLGAIEQSRMETNRGITRNI